jgi:hypothetical protein
VLPLVAADQLLIWIVVVLEDLAERADVPLPAK